MQVGDTVKVDNDFEPDTTIHNLKGTVEGFSREGYFVCVKFPTETRWVDFMNISPVYEE